MTQFTNNPAAPSVDKMDGPKSSANFKYDPARAAEAGRKGGSMSGGNFKNNPSRAAEAGRKGGQASGKRKARKTSGSDTSGQM